jgi:tetrahydromethanopterin S-methyltransferase subunit E
MGSHCRKFGSWSSLVSSIDIILLVGGKNIEQALRNDVFPDAVPPEKSRLISFCMQSQTSEAIWLDMVPFFIMAVIVHGFLANFLIVIVFPTGISGRALR